MRLLTVISGASLATILSGCGVAKAPDEPAAKPVRLEVSPARFSSAEQRPGDEVTLSITVKNTGTNPVPGVIVQLDGLEDKTTEDPNEDTVVRTTKTDLPSDTKRAPWFVDDSPDHSPLSNSSLYPGGRLEPGRSRTLRWRLSATTPGTHSISYRVFGGLTDNQVKATSGTGLSGSVSATISRN